MVERFDDFMKVWGHPEIQQAILGGRWTEVVEKQNKSGKCNGHTWGMVAEKRRDIYPIVGGKHKKWFLCVMCNVGGVVHEKNFESCSGYDG